MQYNQSANNTDVKI